jgi:hypothetical protein
MKHEHYGNFSVADVATKRDGLDLHPVSGAAKWKPAGQSFRGAEGRSQNKAITAACGSSALKLNGRTQI